MLWLEWVYEASLSDRRRCEAVLLPKKKTVLLQLASKKYERDLTLPVLDARIAYL